MTQVHSFENGSRNLANLGAVALLHFLVIYGVLYGLGVAPGPVLPETITLVPTPLPEPPVQEQPPEVPLPDLPPPPVKAVLPDIEIPIPTDVPPSQLTTVRDSLPPVTEVPVATTPRPSETTATKPATIQAACSNYDAVQSWLSDRFPKLADQAGLADQGVMKFELTVLLNIDSSGQLTGLQLLDSSHASAAQAMLPSLRQAFRRLQCRGGQALSLRVPMGFSLQD